LFLVVSGMLAFMSVTGVSGMLNIKELHISLVPPEELHATQPTLFSLHIANRKKWLPSFLLDISCADAAVLCPFLPRASSCTLQIPLLFEKRGIAAIRQVRVSSAFPVNFFIRSWLLPVNCEVLVFPKQIPSAATVAAVAGERRDHGTLPRRGFEGEVERIVEYTGREPLKLIHWRLSARGEEFKVKEFGEPSAEPLLIDPERLPGGLEERVSRAAWLVWKYAEKRPVGLAAGKELILPQQGKRQKQKLLAWLAIYGLKETNQVPGP